MVPTPERMTQVVYPDTWAQPTPSVMLPCRCGSERLVFLPLTRVLLWVCADCGEVVEKEDRRE